MKGTFFQKNIEFRIVIEGESWQQGTRVAGSLQIKNHGSEPVKLGDLRVHLAVGADKKVKAKAEDAFEILETAKPGAEGATLAGGATSEALKWEFTLGDNARITDSRGSLYALYGFGETSTALGQLQLIVVPKLHVIDFLEVLQNGFRYVTKQKTAGKKGSVQVKMAPPSGKDHTSIESLVISFRFEGQDLETDFTFNVKEVDALKGGLALKKGTKSFERVFSPSEYLHSFNQRLNKDAVEKAVGEIFVELKKAPMLGSVE